MANKIEVILLEDVAGVGSTGEIVSVSEGYARNFLFPQGAAALATASTKKAYEKKQAKREAEEQTKLAELQSVAESLSGTELQLTARVKEGTEIFGKITAKMIAQQLNEQAKLSLKAGDVVLPEPITTLGGQDVTVRLSPAVETSIHVVVVADPSQEELKEDDDE